MKAIRLVALILLVASPLAVAQLFITGGHDGITRIDATGSVASYSLPPGYIRKDARLGPDGNIYLSGPGSIVRFNPTTFQSQVMTAAPYSGDFTLGLAIRGGDVYTAEPTSPLEGAVRKFDLATGQYEDDLIASTLIKYPSGLDFNPADGSLYVAAQGNNKILRFDAKTGAFLNDVATVSDLGRICFGPDGNLYVLQAKPSSGTVLKFDPAGNSLGAFDTLATGFTFDPAGELLVAEFNQGAIMRYSTTAGTALGYFVPPVFLQANAKGMVYAPEPAGLLLVGACAMLWPSRRKDRAASAAA